MTKQERIQKELMINGEKHNEISTIRINYIDRLDKQISSIQEKIGKNKTPISDYFETKIKPHGLKFQLHNHCSYWFYKINYVGVNHIGEKYIKGFSPAKGKYVRIYIHNLTMFDLAKTIDYLKLTYDV